MSIAVERDALHHAIDELPDDTLIELSKFIEFLQSRRQREGQTGADVQIEYSQSLPSHQIRERLAQDYDELAAMYDELAGELADEAWLPLENEALARTERLTE
jgi:hypothetical protein